MALKKLGGLGSDFQGITLTPRPAVSILASMIHTETRGSVFLVRMEHGKVNALDAELFEQLGRVLDDAERSAVSSLVLTGSGKAFSAGVDLFRVLDGGSAYVMEFLPKLSQGLERLFLFPKPVVAAVNGHAIAGGCVIACACDYRVMAQGPFTIGLTELLVGVPFPSAALEMIRFAAAPQHLQEILYTGKTYSPEEGLTRGLIDEIAPSDLLLDRAYSVAAQMGSIPSKAFQITKRQIRQSSINQIKLREDLEDSVWKAWNATETHQIIRSYLERTIGKKKT